MHKSPLKGEAGGRSFWAKAIQLRTSKIRDSDKRVWNWHYATSNSGSILDRIAAWKKAGNVRDSSIMGGRINWKGTRRILSNWQLYLEQLGIVETYLFKSQEERD